MKNKKIKAGKNFFLGKIRYRFFLMVCMIPLLAVHPKQDADSHEDCNHIELVASEETGSEITRCLHNNGEGNGNIRIPDEVVTLKLILPFTKEPQDVTLVVYDGIAYMEGDIQIGRIDELKKKALEKGFGIKVTGNKWTNGIIPFKIDPTFSVGQRGSIRGAMDHIGRSTNLCFEDKEPGDANYIYFNRIYTGHPNAHGIGMMGGQQNVSIYDHTRHGVIVHEILHIAGLRHEHVRPDRDNHVIVNDGKGGNPDFIMNDPILDAAYAKVAAGGQYVTYGNYDYQSIMHYDSYYQGNCIWTEKTGKINCDVATINAIIAEINVHGHNTPTYGRFQFMPTMFSKPGREEMGQRDAMSNGDITAINTIYPVKDPNCKQKIIPVPVVEDPPIIRIEIECTPFEMNSYDNPVKSSSQNIRLAPGFRVPKGAFFHAYIGDCPTECEDKSSDILGCCQFENFTMPSVSERWCCQQENSISFTENGVNAYGICSKPIPDEVGTCYRCSVINGVNQVESIAPYNTQALCDTDPAYTWTTDIVSIGDICPTCTDKDPITTVCCVTDNGCEEMSEQACCEAGGDPEENGECGIGSGSGSGCGSDSGTCYRCDLVNGVNEVTLIGALNQTQCEINAFYSWSSSDVSIGDPCPTICADLDPTSTVCCVINEGCQQMSEQACCEIGGHPETGGQCTVIANSTCGATLTGGNCYRCNGNLIEAIAPYNQTQCEADPNYNWSPVTVYIGHACPGSGSGSGTGSGCPGSFDSPATGCCNYPDPISGDDVCGPMSEWECCSYDGQFTPGDISQCDIGTNNCPNSGPKLSNTNIAVQIFPNPNNGTFTFKLDSPLEGVLDMKIFDVTGRVVYEEASSYVLSGEYQKEIQLPASLTDGMYNITVTVGEGQINKRIVIMR